MKPGIYRLICPYCKKEVLENTEDFDQAIKPNGTMFRQIDGVKVNSPHDAILNVKGQNFPCPMCFMPVCTVSGNVMLRDVKTGKVFLSNAVLASVVEPVKEAETPDPIKLERKMRKGKAIGKK